MVLTPFWKENQSVDAALLVANEKTIFQETVTARKVFKYPWGMQVL